MHTIRYILQKGSYISKVDDYLYGSFIEHLGRAVYSGIYEPGHPEANNSGFREDVASMIQELAVTTVRYPGGNFVSGYNWLDGVGPKEQRPVKFDYAWFSKESNQFGINEFAHWCKQYHIEPMIAVNLGTGTPQDAGYFVEYCNTAHGTQYSDLRISHGEKEPHKFKLWCLGNEMDGEWQIGHLSAEDYVKKAREAAKIMKWVDRDIKLVACGSSNSFQKTYPEWDRIVLEGLYEYIDFVSCHHYFENRTGNTVDFLASFKQMDDFIHTIIATADYVKAKLRTKKEMMISFDEWNIWSAESTPWQDYFSDGAHLYQEASPLLEQKYTFLDALSFGGLMCSLLNHSDRVRMASLAQLVNAIAPIMTRPNGEAVRQTIFWPFKMVSQYGRGMALHYFANVPKVTTVHGEANLVQSAAVYNEEQRQIAFFALNIDEKDSVNLEFKLEDFGEMKISSHHILAGYQLDDINDFNTPNKVIPIEKTISFAQGYEVTLPPLSWNMVLFEMT